MRPVHATAIGLVALLGAWRAQAAPAGAPELSLPIACEPGKSCEVQSYVDRDPGPGVLDYRCGHRTYQAHDGVDIRVLDMAAQRAGVAVLAAAPGKVLRLRDGVADISIRAPGAPSVAGQGCGNAVVIDHGGGWQTVYCHLARGSLKVQVGDAVAGGQPIARVGLSGETEFPHLHFMVMRAGRMVDPFAPEPLAQGCPTQAGLWNAEAARALAYRRGAVLSTGFETVANSMDAVEAGGLAAPGPNPPALAAYARLIGLEAGDVVRIRLLGPDGAVLATAEQTLDHDKAQWLCNAGRSRPAAGWAPGDYVGEVTVQRAGATAISRRWRLSLRPS